MQSSEHSSLLLAESFLLLHAEMWSYSSLMSADSAHLQIAACSSIVFNAFDQMFA